MSDHSAPAAAAPRKPPHYSPQINGFRGVCVLLVFAFHVANSGIPPQADPASGWQLAVSTLFGSFTYGVEMFFMISGYVIVLSMRRHRTVAAFLQDRALRIFPVWVPIVLGVCVAGTLGGWKAFANADPLQWLIISTANLFLLPPLVPLPMAHTASWSLTYEWIFYLACGCYAVLTRRQIRMPLLLALWGLAVAAFIVCFPRALFFIPGVLVASQPAALRPLQRTPSWALLPIGLVFLMSWYSTGVIKAHLSTTLWDVIRAGDGLGVVVALVSGTWLFAGLVGDPDRPRRSGGLLDGRAMQLLGTISYSFYLVHPLAMFVVRRLVDHTFAHSLSPWMATAVFTLLSAVVSFIGAWCSWWLLEKRLAGWLRSRLQRRPREAQTPPPLHTV